MMNNEKTNHPNEDEITFFIVDPENADITLRRHIEDCPDCLKQMSQWNEILTKCRDSVKPAPEQWRRITAGVGKRINLERRTWFVLRPVLAGAFLCILLILLVTSPSRQPMMPAVESDQVSPQIAAEEENQMSQLADILLPESIFDDEPVLLTIVDGNCPDLDDTSSIEEVFSIVDPVNGGMT